MPRQPDPLTFIPTADAVRRSLMETEERARKQRILLNVAEQVEAGQPVTVHPAERRETANA
jgi:hypothetical protein